MSAVKVELVRKEPSQMYLVIDGKKMREVEYNEIDCLLHDLLRELGVDYELSESSEEYQEES